MALLMAKQNLRMQVWASRLLRSTPERRAHVMTVTAPTVSARLCGIAACRGRGFGPEMDAGLRMLTRAGPRRHFTRYFIDRRLKRLESAANEVPGDAAMQHKFMRELNQYYPEAVIRRFEMGRFASSEEVVKEYLKAIARTGRLDHVSLRETLLKLQGTDAGKKATASAAAAAADGLGAPSMTHATVATASEALRSAAGFSSKDPLHVTMVEVGWKTQLWRTIRFLAVSFILVSAVGALMDDRGMSSRFGTNHTIHTAESSDKRFSDVLGCDEAKADLQEIVMYLKDPKKFTRLGGKLPSGMLLMGPPGTGKTLLARAIAGEAGVPFFYAAGSEFEEMYVGVGARRVRDLFEAAKKRSPCIIFIDEIDAIGGSRHLKDQQAMKMTLNQLLVEMDGFEQNSGIIVIGATNFPGVLDDALTRPGRFDRHVNVPLPDIKGRQQILDLYMKKIPMAKDTNLEVLARGTPGMSGADLNNLVNQAALRASISGAKAVDHAALEYAKDKILMGAERRSAVISPETARMTAYHEGGHALVALKTSGADPVHKATIMPRGQALGMVMQLPDGDQTSLSRKQMLARMDVCMGGRVAEEIIFGEDEVTSGASSDIQQATSLARSMVTKWGMSEEVGVVYHGKDDQCPETRAMIDREVHKLLTASYSRAKAILEMHRKDLDTIAKGLIENETLTGSELRDLLAGKKVPEKSSIAA